MNLMEKIFQEVEKYVSQAFGQEGSGHDIYHLKRVFNIALNIQEKEGGDRLIIGVAALLHDIHRLMQSSAKKVVTPEESLPRVKEILDTLDLKAEQKNRILNSIVFHENYNFSNTEKVSLDIETQILQDADRLDAIGAIGIGRCFTYSGHYDIPMWLPEVPVDDKIYKVTVHDPSALHHFYTKLLKLGSDMNTDTGRRMAKERHKFMQDFVTRFLDEWGGKF